MSTWLETLRPASFRGVAFEVDGGDLDLGRRVATFEYPQKDTPAHEDLGRKVRTISVEAVLVGADVTDRLRQLEEALETKGAGRLVHPLYGELECVVTSARARWSTKEGRVARVAITFQQTEAPRYPSAKADTAAAVDAGADAALDATAGDFARSFDAAGEDWVTEAAIADAVTLAQGLRDGSLLRGAGRDMAAVGMDLAADAAMAMLPADMEAPLSLGLKLLSLYRGWSAASLGGGTSSASAVMGALPAGTAASLARIGDGRATGPAPARVAEVLLAQAGPAGVGSAWPTVTPTTPSRRREAANREALASLGRIGAAVEAARVGTGIEWASRDEALRWRDRAVDALDHAADRAGEAGWDRSWRAVTDLRGAVVRDVAGRSAPLPRLGTLRPGQTLPAAVLAYDLDGDDLAGLFGRAADLGRRNRIRHPGFVPGGRELEILIDG